MTEHGSGFTLIELLVVLALLAITSAAAVPALLQERHETAERRLVRDVAGLLATTRDLARTTGRSATFVLAPTEQRYWITSGDSTAAGILSMPEDARVVRPTTARVSCSFAADGQATPCALTVRGTGEHTILVNVWSGEIAVRDAR